MYLEAWSSAPEKQGVFVSKSDTPMANYLTVYVYSTVPIPGSGLEFFNFIQDISDLEIVYKQARWGVGGGGGGGWGGGGGGFKGRCCTVIY